MGGFAALSLAHLADTVVVFGPQVDLRISHLRPGLLPDDLATASNRLQENVNRALKRGTRIEFHVACEEHLIYARRLPLPPGSLIVHPINGRIARVLERNGILRPLLVDVLAELQDSSCVRPFQASVAFAVAREDCSECSPEAWDWSDAISASVTLAKWEVGGGMSLVTATPWELAEIIQVPPSLGSWYCSACSSHNEEESYSCTTCREGEQTRNRVGWTSSKEPTKQSVSLEHRCTNCGFRTQEYVAACPKCNGAFKRTCAYCKGTFSEADGKLEAVLKRDWYCCDCWKKYARHNEGLKAELPACWFIPGGQVWSWDAEGGRHRGTIEFDARGRLSTSWGRGSWIFQEDDTCEVCFGHPAKRWLLTRTAGGFSGVTLGNRGSAEPGQVVKGAPMYGEAKPTAASGRFFDILLALFRLCFRSRLTSVSLISVFVAGLIAALRSKPVGARRLAALSAS